MNEMGTAHNERDRILKLRREPLRRDFLITLYTSDAFSRVLTTMANRAAFKKAEGGFVTYKKIGTSDFVIVKRYGLGEIDVDDVPWMVREDTGARISLHDPSAEELVKLGIVGNSWVRAGMGHFHPTSNIDFFSETDLTEFDTNTLGRGEVDFLVPRMYEAFDILGHVYKDRSHVSLFGFALPLQGLRSNEYQAKQFRNTDEQEKVMRKCGFRTARIEVPRKRGRVVLDEVHINQLAELGSQ